MTYTGEEENEQIAHDLIVVKLILILNTRIDETTEDVTVNVESAAVLHDIHSLSFPGAHFALQPKMKVVPCSVNLSEAKDGVSDTKIERRDMRVPFEG